MYIALLTGKADKNVIKGNTKMHEMKMTWKNTGKLKGKKKTKTAQLLEKDRQSKIQKFWIKNIENRIAADLVQTYC